MRPILAIAALLVLMCAYPLFAVTPAHYWSARFGAATDDIAKDVAVDGSGNEFITGSFTGTVDFGGGALMSAGGTDIFLAKYSPSGAHIWSKRFGSTSADVGNAIATDASGNVFIIGNFNGTVDFGGGALASAGGVDIFLAKYNASGTHQWSQRYGSASNFEDGTNVDVDPLGNVIAIGHFSGTVDFGAGPLVSAGGGDIFLARYTTLGAPHWTKRFGDAFDERGSGVATDEFGSIFITGIINGSIDFGGGALVTAGGLDIFLVKFNAGGVHQWSQRFGSTSSDWGHSVDVDYTGSVLLTGYFQSTADFGGGPLSSAGGADIFLAKYDASGAHLWSQRFGNAFTDMGNAVAVDVSGWVYITGLFHFSPINFGGEDLLPSGSSDVFLVRFDANGVHQWSHAFGGVNAEMGNSVTTRGLNDVFLAGEFRQTTAFGGPPLTSAGGADAFVASLGSTDAEPDILVIEDIPNDQGRQVRVTFSRSGHDANTSLTGITQYDVYRWGDSPQVPVFDYVGSVPAHRDERYAIVAPTIRDSTIAEGQYLSSFYVRAATTNPGVFFNSENAAGYSLDNLAPSAPSNFVYSTGLLSWDDPVDGDFDYFSVYGSASDVLDGSAVLVGHTIDTSLDVSSSSHVYYYVTATDFSGNEGKSSRVNTLSGVGGTPAAYALGVNAYPNPFNPATTIRYDIPSAGRVVVGVYDARGALVRTLVDAQRDAGSYPVQWNGSDARGIRASSGVYFARVEFGGQTRTRKVVLLK